EVDHVGLLDRVPLADLQAAVHLDRIGRRVDRRRLLERVRVRDLEVTILRREVLLGNELLVGLGHDPSFWWALMYHGTAGRVAALPDRGRFTRAGPLRDTAEEGTARSVPPPARSVRHAHRFP